MKTIRMEIKDEKTQNSVISSFTEQELNDLDDIDRLELEATCRKLIEELDKKNNAENEEQ